MDNPQELKQKYWNGNKNKSIRYFFYANRGLELFNSFRYLFMLAFGVYYALHLTNPLWLVAMVIISLPVLAIFGYIYVHHMNKVMDYLNIEFATHWGRYSYTLLEKQIQLLEHILDGMTHDNSAIHTRKRPRHLSS